MPRTRSASPREPRPIDADALALLALNYVARYATTRAKLRLYLRRKLRERGWNGADEPPVEAIVARHAGSGHIDDAAFAAGRAAALHRRGYGARRIGEALRAAGIEAEDRPEEEAAPEHALEAALAFARRRRIGPFAATPADAERLRRDIAALLRAGHAWPVARAVAQAAPGESVKGV